MLRLSLMIFAIALLALVDGKHQHNASAELSRLLAMQRQVDHGSTRATHPKLAVTHIAGKSLRQTTIPEITHTKKPGQGYAKGSPLYEKQQKQHNPKATETLLPPSPTGRQRPKLTVIFGCMFVGVMVLVIAGCVNRDFLVRRHIEGGDLPVAPPIKPDIGRQPLTTSTRYDGRAQVEYVDSIPRSTRLDSTLPPTSYSTVSMMPSKQQQYGSMPVSTTSPPGSLGPGAPVSPGQQSPNNSVPQAAIYASMPPQQPSNYLPPPRSYASMPPENLTVVN